MKLRVPAPLVNALVVPPDLITVPELVKVGALKPPASVTPASLRKVKVPALFTAPTPTRSRLTVPAKSMRAVLATVINPSAMDFVPAPVRFKRPVPEIFSVVLEPVMSSPSVVSVPVSCGVPALMVVVPGPGIVTPPVLLIVPPLNVSPPLPVTAPAPVPPSVPPVIESAPAIVDAPAALKLAAPLEIVRL
jgi:hypothetical protein